MEIIRVEGNIIKSTIDGEQVDTFPEGLRIRMANVLNKFEKVKKIDVKRDLGDSILELSEKNVILSSFDKEVEEEFAQVIRLLRWHWRNKGWNPLTGRIGADHPCYFCGRPIMSGFSTCDECAPLATEMANMIKDPSYIL